MLGTSSTVKIRENLLHSHRNCKTPAFSLAFCICVTTEQFYLSFLTTDSILNRCYEASWSRGSIFAAGFICFKSKSKLFT